MEWHLLVAQHSKKHITVHIDINPHPNAHITLPHLCVLVTLDL